MLHCFEGYCGKEGNENRGEGMAPVSQGAPWPDLVLGRLWASGALLWGMVTQCSENWEEPVRFQYRAQPYLSLQGWGGRRSGGTPLGMDRNVFRMVIALGRKVRGRL